MDSKKVAAHWENNAETWTRASRAGYDIYRDALNTPAFLAMLPPVEGKTGLDLGCGEGTNTRKLAERGARLTGVDIAPTFIRHARDAEVGQPLGIDYQVADALALPFENGSFDFVTAFMSLMDMPDQEKALHEVYRVLSPGGFLQFSILHPCFVPPHRNTLRDKDGVCYAVEIAEYFNDVGGRLDSWMFSAMPVEERAGLDRFTIPRFHRTLSAWVAMIRGAGLVIQELAEPMASEAVARAHPTVADTRVTPLFLHVRADKPVTG